LLDSQAAERVSARANAPALHAIRDPVISPEHLWYLMKPTPLRQPSFGERAADNALDLAGKIWNSPNTILGTAYGGLGYAAGLLGGTDPHIQFGHNGFPIIDASASLRTMSLILAPFQLPKEECASPDPVPDQSEE
jgi:hypothetical protein